MKIADRRADNKNTNRCTARGREAVAKSLQKYGADAPFSSTGTGESSGGNKTVEQGSEAGIEDVIIVQSDGTQLVAVQRTDLSLDDPKARAIAIADNRTAEIGLEWDPDILGQLSADLDLKTFFTDEEIQEITGLSDGSQTLTVLICSQTTKLLMQYLSHYRATGFSVQEPADVCPNAASKSDCCY